MFSHLALANTHSPDFFQHNAPAVKKHKSGIEYQIIQSSKLKKAKKASTVKFHYEGRLANQTIFDSSISRDEPITTPLTALIPGVAQTIRLMRVGEIAKVFIPAELAYGVLGTTNVPPNTAVYFEIRLLEIID